MSRNSSGDYSLPAGNPVVTATPITIAWANGTLDDVATALTDSLSRAGDGGMLAALELDAGVVGAPGLTFGAETTLGLYRASAGVLGVAVGGAQVASFLTTGITVTGTCTASDDFRAPDGNAATPSYGFTTDTDTGMFHSAANVIGFATNAVERVTIGLSNLTNSLVLLNPLGSAAAPSYSFTGDTDTGLSSAVANTLVLSTAGVARLTVASTGATLDPVLLGPDGAVGAPAFAFSGDADTGIFRSGTALIRFACDGVEAFRVGPTVITTLGDVPLRGGTGSAATPSLAFNGDTDTGFYNESANEIGFSLGGTGFLVGYRNVPANTQNGNYTAVLTDSGKMILKASGGASETITIPANASVAYPLGTVLTVANIGGGALTIAITTDTLTWADGGAAGPRTLADNGLATAIKVATTEWLISGTGLS